MQHIDTAKSEIGKHLNTLPAMRRAWDYYKRWILCTDEYLKLRKGSKKRLALENKARIYYMHYYRMFIVYCFDPKDVIIGSSLARVNSARLGLGYKMIPYSELATRKGYNLP